MLVLWKMIIIVWSYSLIIWYLSLDNQDHGMATYLVYVPILLFSAFELIPVTDVTSSQNI